MNMTYNEKTILNKCFNMIIELETNEDTNYMNEKDLNDICDFMKKYKI